MAEEKKYSGYGQHGGGRKAKTMSIVCTRSEKEKIKQDANEYNLSVSEYCTKKLLDKL